MGRMYSASFTGVSVSAIQDLFEILGPADAVTRLHSLHIAQSSDYGDAEAEGLQIQISKTDGSTLTPDAHSDGDPAYGGTVEANNTTQATVTTVVQSYAFNAQAGFYYQPTPEERIDISPSGTLA